MKIDWNKKHEPISERLREEKELLNIIKEKTLIWNIDSKKTGMIMEVYEVSQDKGSIEDGYSMDEDRWVEYMTTDGIHNNFSVDLDDEGWIWHEELKQQDIT